MTADLLTHRGGRGAPLILVHGLMGRGSTWSRQLPWLTRLGAVYTYDAPWHRGRDVDDPYPISTERFVADLGDAVAALGAPARLVGHSMGGLHSWCLAAERPELARRWWSKTWHRISGAAPPGLGSCGCIICQSNSTLLKRYSPNSGQSLASTSWRRSTVLQPVGGCTATPRGGSRSQQSGAPATTGRSGGRCDHPCC